MNRHERNCAFSTVCCHNAAMVAVLAGAVAVEAGQAMPMPQGQKPSPPQSMNAMADDEVAHPFFAHMGMPEGVGVYSLRLAGLSRRVDGETTGDFAFHFETGLTESIGLHVRNDNFRNMPRTEVMLQFAVAKGRNGMSGWGPLIEFEIPTRPGGNRIETLVGGTATLANARAAFNHVIHYNPRMDMVDTSGALVAKLGTRWFPVLEVLGSARADQRPTIGVLVGLKVQANKLVILGFAWQVPISSNKEFSSQLVFQPDLGWTRMR